MATYFLFGKYSAEAVKSISPDRTEKAGKLTGIAFTTSEAIAVEEFDKMTAGL